MGLQEPPLHKGNVVGLDRRHHIFYARNSSARAALLLSSDLDAWLMPEYTNKDMATCMCVDVISTFHNRLSQHKGEGVKQNLVVTSLYLDITSSQVWPEKFERLVNYCRRRRLELLVLSDTNCHSSLWGCDSNNARGDTFEVLLANTNLSVQNVGSVPTFQNARSETIIDVTLATPLTSNLIEDWKVKRDIVGTDHNLITFRLTISTHKIKYQRNLKGAFDSFQERMEKKMFTPPTTWSEAELNRQAEYFERDIIDVLNETHPVKRVHHQVRPPTWWNDECHELKRRAYRLQYRYRKNRSEDTLVEAREARLAFSRAIRRAKRKSWQLFTESCNTPKDLATLNRIIQRKDNQNLGILQKGDGDFCDDHQETLQLLVDTHFPKNRAPQGSSPSEERTGVTDDERVSFITKEKVQEAIASFGDLKAAGPDDIKPVILKNLGGKALNRLTELYRASVVLGFIPTNWQRSKVIFIPKPGKKDYTQARSFRPISLTSFILKTLERVWAWEVEKTTLIDNPLCDMQHAFRRGYSTESALSNMAEYIEKGMNSNGFAMAVLLDIQGAFDNIPTRVIIAGMRRKGLPDIFVNWYENLLKNRCIEATLKGAFITKNILAGTPQGGVLSPLAWNLAFESFLELYNTGPVRVNGFADDAGLVAIGGTPAQLAIRLQEAVDKATRWGDLNGLTFSPAKTEAILFTRKRKFPPPRKIQVKNTEIAYSDHVKYLGVWFDSKLTWSKHAQQKIKATKMAINNVKGAVGKLWGPDPKHTQWLFTAVIRPALTYGALVWAKSCLLPDVKKQLNKLHRVILFTLGNFRRSTPTAGLEVITGNPPLDLWINLEATLGYQRTKSHCKVDPSDLRTTSVIGRGHRQHCRILRRELELPEEEEDQIPSERIWQRSYGVNLRSMHEDSQLPVTSTSPDQGIFSIFTDGSKLQGCTGSGYKIWAGLNAVREKSYHLGRVTTVFQAEVHAIKEAADYFTYQLKHRLTPGDRVRLYTDSQAALQALASIQVRSRLVRNCVETLNEAARDIDFTIHWVKAHVGNPGNEDADKLAKEGAKNPAHIAPDRLPLPKTEIRNRYKKQMVAAWNERYKRDPRFRQTKMWFPEVDLPTSKRIMSLSRAELSHAVQVITGHNFLRRHNSLIDDGATYSECRLCLEDEETSHHIVAECPALGYARFQVFGVIALKQPLVWSGEMVRFIRESSIGHLLNQCYAEEATVAEVDAGGEE